jgi:hypothetical protein
MKKRSRIPLKHIDDIINIAKQNINQPRYVLASNLVKINNNAISIKTALDYIKSAKDEGIIP